MSEIGIGVIGGGYMGKAHSVAMATVGAVFDTPLRPRLEMIAARSEQSAENYRRAFGFVRATDDWRTVVADPRIDAVIVAAPQDVHFDITQAALANGKHVLCEKPLAATHAQSVEIAALAASSSCTTMVGFNYICTPVTQYALQLIGEGAIGQIVSFRAEHTEDFFADPNQDATWRSFGRANGAMGDLAPHILQAALAFMGPVDTVMAEIETVISSRPGASGQETVTSDDQAHLMCRFQSGVLGHVFVSRIATGRKMGYAYEITGTAGTIKFDQEDQNALWLYRAEGSAAERGFQKILAGPSHPDYLPFCQGPGHGTGYQDQIIIEASHFLNAIHSGKPAWPGFDVGLNVSRIVEAAWQSNDSRGWVPISAIVDAE